MTPKKQRRRSMRQERELAAATGGRVQAGSGAVAGKKGDVRARGRLRAECKYTRMKSYRVTRADLNKISSEASFGEVPLFDISFLGSDGRTEDRWVLLPYADWLRLSGEVPPAAPTTGYIRTSDWERSARLAQEMRARGEPDGVDVIEFNGMPWSASAKAILCEHANENPFVCPCLDTCYCRTHTCKDKDIAARNP